MKMDVVPAARAGDDFCAHAGWFGPAARPRFGWLYRPNHRCGSTGIVIVPPFGIEDICAHRSLRHLAEACAQHGFPTLRFDLDGCGDSAGDDSDPDRVGCWIASVCDACELVRAAGSNRIVLVGLRLGATLAALAALRRRDVAALVAFGAVAQGARWLRELRALQATADLRAPAPASGGQEAAGFVLTAATCAAINSIDLTRLAAPAPRVLMLERDDLPVADGWYRHLQAAGCQAAQQRVPGYLDMLGEPHLTQVAQAFIETCVGYVCSLPDSGAAPACTPVLRRSVTLHADGMAIRETVVSPGAGIFGILAEPRVGSAERAVLMLNAGAVRHIGVNRFDVGFSRQLAARGVAVLRVDLSGLGDSPARAGARENITFGTRAIEDVGLCVAWLRARGTHELSVTGICSGATHALGAAVAGQPIDAVCLINCGVFLPRPGLDPASDRRFRDIAHYNRTMKSTRAWRKLLSGKVDIRRIARVAIWKIALRAQSLWRNAARRAGVPLQHDLGRTFAVLDRRGVKVHFLYSGDDPGRIRLAMEAGSSVSKHCRAGCFSMHVFTGVNHTFTQRRGQASLSVALRQILLPPARVAPARRRDLPLPR